MKWRVLSLCVLSIVCARGAMAGEHSFDESRQVKPGDQFVLRAHRGYAYISAWDRNELRILAQLPDGEEMQLRELRNIYIAVAPSAKEDYKLAEFDITVPKWMEVEVEGHTLEVEIEGLVSKLSVEVIEGNIQVIGGKDRIFLRSLQGSIRVEHAEGRIDVASSHDNVTVLDSSGQLLAEAINGDIRLSGVRSDNVEAISFSGGVLYDGSIEPGGDYYFSTHDGDIDVALGEEASAAVTIITKQGDFTADFELKLMPMTNRDRLEFVLGDGKARVRAESFSGDVHFFDPKTGRKKKG